MLYLTKHSRPDVTNPVRELSKSFDGASMANGTEMYWVIHFVHPVWRHTLPTLKDIFGS